MKKETILPDFFKPILWGLKWDALEIEKDKEEIILAALNHGELEHLKQIEESISDCTNVKGGWIGKGKRVYVLAYGKKDAILLLKFMYYPQVEHYLKRKYKIAEEFLRVQPNW